MNQEQNNYNNQVNKVTPNNQPLQNNQNLNNNSYPNQPIGQNMSTQQEMNNASSNVLYQQINSNNDLGNNQISTQQIVSNSIQSNVVPPKQPKKNKVGLIVGIVGITVLVIVLIAVLIFISSSNKENPKTQNSNVEDKQNVSVDIESIINNDEGTFFTNFTNYELGFYFKYPVFVNLSEYDKDQVDMREYNVLVYDSDSYDSISSILGSDSIRLIYMNEFDEFSDNLLNDVENLFKKNSGIFQQASHQVGNLTKVNYVEKITSNNIEWKKYNLEYETGLSTLVYLTSHDGITLALSFGPLESVHSDNKFEEMSDKLWEKVSDNKEKISDYIVKSFNFTDDKEYLLNLKEASVLYYNTIYEIQHIGVFDSLGENSVLSARVPDVGYADGIMYENKENLSIDNVLNKLLTTSYAHTIFNVNDYNYTIKNTGETMVLKHKYMGDIQVKFYEYEKVRKDPKYSKYKEIEKVFVLVTEKYYGIISASTVNELVYALKNITIGDFGALWVLNDFIENK